MPVSEALQHSGLLIGAFCAELIGSYMSSNGPVERFGMNPMLVQGPGGLEFEAVDMPESGVEGNGQGMERTGPGAFLVPFIRVLALSESMP